MKQNQKGFTLIELLVVIAIIAILTAIVTTSLNSSKTKANKAAFKSEMASVKSALIYRCDSFNLTASDPGIVNVTNDKRTLGTIATTPAQSCGPTGSGTFSVSFNAAPDGTNAGTIGGCTGATVTEAGITYTGTGC